MLGMPVGSNAFATLQVSTEAYPLTSVTVPGFDAFINTSEFETSAPVVFK
jgi:hypothetical protein